MANQGNQGNQGDSERQGNLGQGRPDVEKPTGTSGRQGKIGEENTGEGNPESGRRKNPEDDESPLGTRNTNR